MDWSIEIQLTSNVMLVSGVPVTWHLHTLWNDTTISLVTMCPIQLLQYYYFLLLYITSLWFYCFLTRDLYLLIPFTYFIHPLINTLKRHKWTNKILCIIMLTRILIRIINGHSHSLSFLDSSSILIFQWRIINIWLQLQLSVLTNAFPKKPNIKGSERRYRVYPFLSGLLSDLHYTQSDYI